ncbi:MAG: HIT domain-containing protein [Gammaproteobacteria bacterium]|uniref:HIT domain-containing protein n=1 Tax=Pseudomaricurvus alcaniphilus TaxID=1166482 RepID=UPI001409124A|nr:HIT domain-containing protein [Pseudomaricurvus alcaniphilus]MBR9908879.1 HIT domain-containing protein [Gammaproteobacteria bacterium]NHN37932.1 HIT domain-containing protein [Pseudomaricurvus alcaniphilus]
MSELDVEKKFELNPVLAEDSVVLGEFPLSLVLLSRDANYPWCILVPKRSGKREIHHLAEVDRQQLMAESCHLAEVMADLFVPDKMNVAALGNLVPQLHLHHVARFKSDKAWPGSIWGVHPPAKYTDKELKTLVSRLCSALAGDDFKQLAGTGGKR